MANPHSSHTATLLADGRTLVVGGFASEKTAELYDATSNSWTSAGELINARLGHTATRLANGQILVAGGSSSGPAGYLASADVFDPATNRWTAAANRPDVPSRLPARDPRERSPRTSRPFSPLASSEPTEEVQQRRLARP